MNSLALDVRGVHGRLIEKSHCVTVIPFTSLMNAVNSAHAACSLRVLLFSEKIKLEKELSTPKQTLLLC